MRAAVLHAFGETPRCEEVPELRAEPGQTRVEVLAVSLQNAERLLAGGEHYASAATYPKLPATVGLSGVGRVNGMVVGFGGCIPPHGAMAEATLVPTAAVPHFSAIPGGVDPALAAAVPASALTSLIPLAGSAALEKGETVLVQGATGFAGRLAVQIAKKLGAGRVVGTGRDAASLRALGDLGADAVIDLGKSEAKVTEAFVREAGDGYGVVIDYLWGRPTELLLATLVPKSFALPRAQTRVVHVGAAAGDAIALTGEMVRTSGVSISGMGGRMDRTKIPELAAQVFAWLASGELRAEVERVPLADIARAWRRTTHGSRLVVVP